MPETLNAALEHAVVTWPEKTFLRVDGRQVSFAEFDADVGRLAAGLRDAGLRRGDRLVVFMRNSLACLHTWFAANRLGAVWAPINTEFRGLALSHVCALAQARLFVVDADLRDPLVAALATRTPACSSTATAPTRSPPSTRPSRWRPSRSPSRIGPRCSSRPGRPAARRRASSPTATS